MYDYVLMQEASALQQSGKFLSSTEYNSAGASVAVLESLSQRR